MFSFWKKKPATPAYTEQVWMEKAYKYKALAAQAAAYAATGGRTLVIVHFEQTFDEVCQALETAQNPYACLATHRNATAATAAPWHTLVLMSEFLQARHAQALNEVIGQAPGQLVFAEHFPLRSTDEHLLNLLHQLLPSANTMFYTALNDAVLQAFAGNVKEVMQGMGMGPEESISHRLVSQSIARAQEQIEKKTIGNAPAVSAQEWVRKNTTLAL